MVKTYNSKLMLILTYTGLILFWWVIYPYKWINAGIAKLRNLHALTQAKELCHDINKAVYVCRDGHKIYVNTRENLRRANTKNRKKLSDSHRGYLDWDYRYALVYKVDPNGTITTY